MLQEIVELLKSVGREELLTRLQRVETQIKSDGSPVTAADLASNKRITDALLKRWPEYPVLSEESPEQQQYALNHTQTGVWVLDPLDGTTNFSCGIPYFCISLAFIQDNKLQLGVIYDPVRDEVFSAKLGEGASLNGKPLTIDCQRDRLKCCVAVVDFKRLSSDMATSLAISPPYASQRSYGSVALDWCWIAAGRGQLYLHGSMNLWDYAAGLLIFAESGGAASTLDGDNVFTCQLQKRSAIAASTADLLNAWSTALKAIA